MKYPLDFKNDAASSLRYWLDKYIRNKLTTLSNVNVENKDNFAMCLKTLNYGTKDIDELKEVCKRARHLGLIGINTYANPLFKLYEYMEKFGARSLKEIDEDLLIDFMAVYTSGLSPASRKNHRIALIGFFGFIDKHNGDDEGNSYIFNIELKNLSNAKATKKLPSYLTKDEINAFLESIDTMPQKDIVAVRNRLIIKLIIHTGMRVSEAVRLKIKDVVLDGDFYIIRVRGKGNKMRMRSVVASHFTEQLEFWKNQRSEMIASENNEFLFISNKGKPVTQPYIYRCVEELLHFAGINKEKNGAHMLRHTYATQLYNAHKDLLLVQESLGHASLDTSRIYTHFDDKKLKVGAYLIDDINKKDDEDKS